MSFEKYSRWENIPLTVELSTSYWLLVCVRSERSINISPRHTDLPSVSYNSKLLIPLIKDFIVCRSAIIEKYYSQAEKQIVCVTDLGEPFNVGNLAKDDLAETGMPCVIYGELFTTYGEIISQIESHTNKTEGMILS